MKELVITSLDEKQRLEKYLKRIFPEMGTGFLYKMLRKKNITLNGKKATGSEQLISGDLIQCFFSDETFDKFSGAKTAGEQNEYNAYQKAYDFLRGIRVIYEDEHILLLDKPAGILSQKAEAEDVSINEWMIGYLLNTKAVTEDSLKRFKPSVCNRLDRNTSGLVICGKTLPGSREMSRILKERTLQKYYRTYVYGKLEGEKVLEAYYRKDESSNQAKIFLSKQEQNTEQYASIVTAYRSIMAKADYSYLEIKLITGKTHQIRAHLSAYGHPIVGDPKYGGQNKNKGYPKYQLLHAYRIVFPILNGELSYLSKKEFICPEPEAFLQFKKQFF